MPYFSKENPDFVKRVEDAVEKIEAKSDTEIVVVIAKQSSDYEYINYMHDWLCKPTSPHVRIYAHPSVYLNDKVKLAAQVYEKEKHTPANQVRFEPFRNQTTDIDDVIVVK